MSHFTVMVVGDDVAAALAPSCDECSAAVGCALVFEPYNIDGDCLASK